jgi:hypothetical protein
MRSALRSAHFQLPDRPQTCHLPSHMALRRYSPPIRRLQEEYSQAVARRVIKARRPQRGTRPRITDNSEPWNPNPRTVSELWEIACQVQALAEVWGPRG